MSRGLIAYGMVGLAVALIGLGALIWVDGRVSSLRRDVDATLAQRAATVGLAANVLHGAATTVDTFAVTVDQSSQAVSSVAVTIIEARSDLSALEAQLRSVNILGAAPLASSADAVSRIAASIEGLDTRLTLIADSLDGNRAALAGNATTIRRLGDLTDELSARLGSGVVGDSLGDLQRLISITLLVLAAWAGVPAVGALVLGAWLRRELDRPRAA